jgi:hypothetical protein
MKERRALRKKWRPDGLHLSNIKEISCSEIINIKDSSINNNGRKRLRGPLETNPSLVHGDDQRAL